MNAPDIRREIRKMRVRGSILIGAAALMATAVVAYLAFRWQPGDSSRLLLGAAFIVLLPAFPAALLFRKARYQAHALEVYEKLRD